MDNIIEKQMARIRRKNEEDTRKRGSTIRIELIFALRLEMEHPDESRSACAKNWRLRKPNPVLIEGLFTVGG